MEGEYEDPGSDILILKLDANGNLGKYKRSNGYKAGGIPPFLLYSVI